MGAANGIGDILGRGLSSAVVWVLLGIAAAAGIACAFPRTGRVWARTRRATVTMGAWGMVRVPEELRPDRPESRDTSDYATFTLRRINSHHLNGQVSFAETLQLTVFAEDFEMERIERGAREPAFDSILSKAGEEIVLQGREGAVRWKVSRTVYERDPVKEPAWEAVVLNERARVQAEWMGYQKRYTAAEALQNLREMLAEVTVAPERAARFQALRDWPTRSWRAEYASNLQRLNMTLARRGMPAARPGEWVRSGSFRYLVDRERPQRFLLVVYLGEGDRRQGPVDFHGPVTKYFVAYGSTVQDNQGHGGGLVPREFWGPMLGEDLAAETNYYYAVRTLNLWREYGELGNPLPAAVDAMFEEIGRMQAEYAAGRLVTTAERI